ncbi:hypothetical protein KC343_g11073 [Hortaea werneckii]|uniref:DUF4604 domain-containing protein n=1 Tax=Hortaea werneckii TaxID=91943 RepID=A0A3M7BV92_HORWE|nr:hypothetical protein KC352_g27915 [Hortaea werneckii]KAI7546015.1 hypothetical protein KC317_g15547 [Hortaea werneckii]KAI7610585.1 hypothetical protein KC346_g8670 [Hortaea werneckii]KAI7612901.1 hypothetical protein KC343_g11073 [Hortaea werneckii]KAI7643439.1 hypothetical protein KC319_g12641 [Hortaea werneckii]
MSGDKIKSKDLSYDSSLPPFLQRLRDQNSGRDTDRHEREIARPKGKKDPQAEEEDGPTVVDDSGETLTKEQVASMNQDIEEKERSESNVGGSVKGKLDNAGDVVATSGALPDDEPTRKGDTVTEGKAVKKRKVGKVVGGDEHEDEEEAKGDEKTRKPSDPAASAGEKESAGKKIKKKAKQIKLAFNDDEEG